MLTSLYPSRILGKITAFAKANRFLLLMMLILIFVREGMIIFDMWTTKEGGDLPEGLISGNFAFDILDGAWRGWDSYLYIKRGNLGNELMTGVFAIPLYLLFGNSLFVLSQVQLLSSLAILSLMYVFCKKYLGSNIAKIASLLFVCLPISVQSYLIYPYYLYFDNFLYTLLAFLLFLKLIDCDKPTTKIASSTLLGFVSGIGFFHTEMYSLTIGCVLFFWFLKNRLFFIKKEFLLFLAGLIVALIPSFCFGLDSYIAFFSQLFSGEFNYAYGAAKTTQSYLKTLDLMSIGFWPVKNLFLSAVNDTNVTILGIALLLITVVWIKAQNKFQTPFALLVFYAFSLMTILFIFKASVGYYFHPLLVPATIILSVLIHNIQTKWFSKTCLKKAFYVTLSVICFANVYDIVKNFDIKNLGRQLNKQLSINGCCYYWTMGYTLVKGWTKWYIPPDGFKTELGIKVESIATKTAFAWQPINESVPQKKIYINSNLTAQMPLPHPVLYAIYGKDVSFEGLEKLANEIRLTVPEPAKQYAYMGLAVYYVNDNWLKDLLKDFKAGVIEKNIPKEFQKYFYMELTRKIYSRYYDKNQAKIDQLLNMFEGQQKNWMLDAVMWGTSGKTDPNNLTPPPNTQ